MKALVLGGAGQDGSYLIERLRAAGHQVYATSHRRHPSEMPAGDRLRWAWTDLGDEFMVNRLVARITPDVIFNLAAVTTPGADWTSQRPEPDVADVNGLGVLLLLRAVEEHAPRARVIHASSSAIYDPVRYGLYGASKVFAHSIVAGYRQRGIWASNAVLYSHTSPRQDRRFLVPRMCQAAARIHAGQDPSFTLRHSEMMRDWMSARDAVGALLAIAEAGEPGDFDVASGVRLTARSVLGLALRGTGHSPEALIFDVGEPVPIERPAELGPLLALGWRPTEPLSDVIAEMVQAERGRL